MPGDPVVEILAPRPGLVRLPACVAMRDGDRLQDLDGAPIWPAHGRGTGAARW